MLIFGYLAGHKAYELYDLDIYKIFSRLDVIFQETTFPYESVVGFQWMLDHILSLQNKKNLSPQNMILMKIP